MELLAICTYRGHEPIEGRYLVETDDGSYLADSVALDDVRPEDQVLLWCEEGTSDLTLEPTAPYREAWLSPEASRIRMEPGAPFPS